MVGSTTPPRSGKEGETSESCSCSYPAKREGNASLRVHSMFVVPFLQSMREMNNFIIFGEYAFVSSLSPSDRFYLVKKIATRVMRKVPLLNLLVVDPEEG